MTAVRPPSGDDPKAAYTIRDAAVQDWPQVAGLLVELGRDVSPSAVSNPSYVIRFGGHLALRESRTLVAEELGGGLLGFVDLEFRQRLGHPRPQAWVNDLVVTEPMRGRGVGAALLARAEELALKRGCFRMSLETAAWRDGTHRFYEHEGWTDNGKWFVKLLDESWGKAGYDE
jgi:GNAT superfamily N-acetyltransferase